MIEDPQDMETARARDAIRRKAVNVSRAAKEIFFAYFAPRRWSWRAVFFAPGHDRLRRASELVLKDLGNFCFATRSTFSSDPYLMGVREGRRQVWLRIVQSLELDERQVQQLMEVDDGV